MNKSLLSNSIPLALTSQYIYCADLIRDVDQTSAVERIIFSFRSGVHPYKHNLCTVCVINKQKSN